MEDKIEVGEYVRTKNGRIKKIINIYTKMIIVGHGMQDMGYFCKFDRGNNIFAETFEELQMKLKKHISKHTKNIKKLIEAEDCLIYKLKGINSIRKGFVKRHVDPRSNKENLSIDFYGLEQIEILDIVTKEQFNSVKYEVEKE